MVEGRGLREREFTCFEAKISTRPSSALGPSAKGARVVEKKAWEGRWTETRLAQAVALDCRGGEWEDDLEVHGEKKWAKEKIAFEYWFEPASECLGRRFRDRPLGSNFSTAAASAPP
jgi:hypothetical protein